MCEKLRRYYSGTRVGSHKLHIYDWVRTSRCHTGTYAGRSRTYASLAAVSWNPFTVYRQKIANDFSPNSLKMLLSLPHKLDLALISPLTFIVPESLLQQPRMVFSRDRDLAACLSFQANTLLKGSSLYLTQWVICLVMRSLTKGLLLVPREAVWLKSARTICEVAASWMSQTGEEWRTVWLWHGKVEGKITRASSGDGSPRCPRKPFSTQAFILPCMRKQPPQCFAPL